MTLMRAKTLRKPRAILLALGLILTSPAVLIAAPAHAEDYSCQSEEKLSQSYYSWMNSMYAYNVNFDYYPFLGAIWNANRDAGSAVKGSHLTMSYDIVTAPGHVQTWVDLVADDPGQSNVGWVDWIYCKGSW